MSSSPPTASAPAAPGGRGRRHGAVHRTRRLARRRAGRRRRRRRRRRRGVGARRAVRRRAAHARSALLVRLVPRSRGARRLGGGGARSAGRALRGLARPHPRHRQGHRTCRVIIRTPLRSSRRCRRGPVVASRCSATPHTPCCRTSARAAARRSRTRRRWRRSLADGAAAPEALRAYERSRKPRADDIARQSRRMSALAHLRNPAATTLRNLAMRAAPAAAMHRRLDALVDG